MNLLGELLKECNTLAIHLWYVIFPCQSSYDYIDAVAQEICCNDSLNVKNVRDFHFSVHRENFHLHPNALALMINILDSCLAISKFMTELFL